MFALMQPMEKKVNDEIVEKETETVDVVKDKSTSDSIQITVKEEKVDQTLMDEHRVLTADSKKESPVVVVEEVAAVENSEESSEKVKDECSEKEAVDEKEKCVEEVNVEAVDEEKETVEDVADEVKEEKSFETEAKEDVKIVDVTEARGKHEDVEAVSAVVRIETAEVKVAEVESKLEASEKIETWFAEAKESASEVEVKAEENSEMEVKLEEKTVEGPEEVVLISQDLVSEPKKETEEVVNSSSSGFIEKISAEAKHVVEEPSNDKEENESKDKDDESIKADIETESKEKENAAKIQEEVAEALEAEVKAEEVGVKAKHSNNIISKVKQSLVKAKKAIIGKPPSSKATSTEAKEEINVK